MDWLARLFRPHVELAPELAQRVRAWRELSPVDRRTPVSQARFIVVDVETSGLNPRRDRLLSIGAVVVEGERVNAGEGFEALLKTEQRSERDNILIHGIGPQAQAAGEAPEEAMIGFLEFIGKHPLVAFHASFDREILDRMLRGVLGVHLLNPWLDLAQLAPALVPEGRLTQSGLDAWLDYYGLRAQARHRATDDAFVTAELFLILLARGRLRGLTTLSALQTLSERQAKFLSGSGAGGA